MAPFTFYENLISSSSSSSSSTIDGYWGGAFGDPRDCQDCALNPLANTAFLVTDQ